MGSFFDRTSAFLKLVGQDISQIWLLELPFPTFIKLIITILLGMVAIFALIFPLLLVFVTILPFERFFTSSFEQSDGRDMFFIIYLTTMFQNWQAQYSHHHEKEIREFLFRWVLVCNSIATSVDYLQIMQQLLQNVLP